MSISGIKRPKVDAKELGDELRIIRYAPAPEEIQVLEMITRNGIVDPEEF